MKKIFLILVVFVSILYCKPLNNGFYINKKCSSSILEVYNSSLKVYNIDSKKYSSYSYKKEGKYYTLQKAKESHPLANSSLKIDNSEKFKILDSDNMTSCKGESLYTKVNSIKALASFLDKSNKFNFPYSFYSNIKNEFLIGKSNVEVYNNLAFYLYKKGYYQQADFLLEMVLERFPNRTVAYLNYADNLDKLIDQNPDKYYKSKDELTKYYLTYISQMIFKNKENILPQKVKIKYQKYFTILKELNKTVKKPFVVLDFAKGELIKDYKEVISFVIEFADSKKVKEAKRYLYKLSNGNSRVWLVFFKDKEKYSLISKNTTLLKPDKITSCEDPFASIDIKNNSIFLDTHYWCSMGGWGQGGTTYQVLSRNKQLILAGIESWNDNRADGAGSKSSINFLTKKKIYYKTIDHGDEVGDAKLSKIKDKTPILFKDIDEW